MRRTIPLGVVLLMMLVGFLLGLLVPRPDPPAPDPVPTPPSRTIIRTCVPVPDDTDVPLPPGQVACGG